MVQHTGDPSLIGVLPIHPAHSPKAFQPILEPTTHPTHGTTPSPPILEPSTHPTQGTTPSSPILERTKHPAYVPKHLQLLYHLLDIQHMV